MSVSVGFIGVGNMGNPMAANVLKNGFPMTVFDKNPRAMENLILAGAKKGSSAKDVVDASEIVMTSLPASLDVEEAYLSPGGLVESAKPGTILIDLSSVLPSTPRKLEPAADLSRFEATAPAALPALFPTGNPRVSCFQVVPPSVDL